MARDRSLSPASLTIPEELRGETVLVTGGAGFVGSHLARALVDDCDVRVLDDLSEGHRGRVPDDCTFVEGDVRETGALVPAADGVDVIFHQAGLVSVPESIDRPVESHGRNVDGTLAVLEAARRTDARVVVASSAAVYGRPSSVPIGEDEQLTPAAPYGVDKLAAEQYARLYHELYGVPTVSLRYFNVYGPGQASGVVNAFLEQVQSGDPLTVEGDGSQTRDFVHVVDVIRANLAAATTEAAGRAYNIGTGEATRIDDLAALIRELAGVDVEIRHAEGRAGDIQDSCADVSRARDQLGFDAAITLDAGLADVVGVHPLRQ
ncbi:MAG: NAD-dependent epimerase/dehydratase family protein [Halolamina sp.]